MDKDGLLEHSDCIRFLNMAGRKEQAETALLRMAIPLTLQRFYDLWPEFGVDTTQFLHYILTRIQIETERRKSYSRHPSLIFKPIPILPTGDLVQDDSFSSDFDSSSPCSDSSDASEGDRIVDNNKMVAIDDETLEDVYFEIAATLPYSDEEEEAILVCT